MRFDVCDDKAFDRIEAPVDVRHEIVILLFGHKFPPFLLCTLIAVSVNQLIFGIGRVLYHYPIEKW